MASGPTAVELRRWAGEHQSQIQFDEQVLKSAVHEHVCASGECPDGAELAGGDDTFFIK